ncbi:hypothetical protein GXW82_10240 [Streptacidiphilus sp. 4-A2]|nr:hypothetical protein [Streptacidiphilus sp. 4-A2]
MSVRPLPERWAEDELDSLLAELDRLRTSARESRDAFELIGYPSTSGPFGYEQLAGSGSDVRR